MMIASMILAALGVFLIGVIAVYGTWQWGPGLRNRMVYCPVLKKRATVLAEQKEAGFPNSYAGLEVVDVTSCSLVAGQPLECRKACIQNL